MLSHLFMFDPNISQQVPEDNDLPGTVQFLFRCCLRDVDVGLQGETVVNVTLQPVSRKGTLNPKDGELLVSYLLGM